MSDRRDEQSSAVIAGDRDGDERLSAETERAYDATVERYGARWNVVDPLVDAKREFVAAAGPNALVADVGCGTGRDLAWFTREGHRAIGVDRSRRMLQFAAAVAPMAALVRADGRHLPFGPGVVDAWWACAVLLHLPPAGALGALTDAQRVTRNGGVGFVAVKQGSGAQLEPIDETEYRRYLCYWKPDDLDDLIRRAGWVIERAWTADDALGRQPWLSRMLRRA